MNQYITSVSNKSGLKKTITASYQLWEFTIFIIGIYIDDIKKIRSVHLNNPHIQRVCLNNPNIQLKNSHPNRGNCIIKIINGKEMHEMIKNATSVHRNQFSRSIVNHIGQKVIINWCNVLKDYCGELWEEQLYKNSFITYMRALRNFCAHGAQLNPGIRIKDPWEGVFPKMKKQIQSGTVKWGMREITLAQLNNTPSTNNFDFAQDIFFLHKDLQDWINKTIPK